MVVRSESPVTTVKRTIYKSADHDQYQYPVTWDDNRDVIAGNSGTVSHVYGLRPHSQVL